MRYQLNKTKMDKDEAEKEHREYRIKTARDLEIKDQVRDDTDAQQLIHNLLCLKLMWFYSCHLFPLHHF